MPRIAILDSDNLKQHWEDQPKAWEWTGAPNLMILDADSPEQWELYASKDASPDDLDGYIREQASGYTFGYYPIDIADWQMIPAGPFCAACVDPRDEIEGGVIPSNRIDLPQAWISESLEEPEQDFDGTYLDRHCEGCGVVLVSAEDWNQ